jgi:hypothetical protein
MRLRSFSQRRANARALLAVLACLAANRAAVAGPRVDLTNRMTIDGFSSEFEFNEALFGINDDFVRDGRPCVEGGDPPCPPEESPQDSQWGFFNDVNQIKVTWDARFLYVAVDGISSGNNIILFFDVTRANRTDLGPGIPDLVNVNAWRRNITFANGFAPDFFLATWDGNATPQMWTYSNPRVVNQVSGSSFGTAATFSSNAQGRSMEAAIPWRVLFQRDSTLVSSAYADTVPVIPAGFDTLRLAACLTAGADGTGSPDSAPDNFSGFQVDGNAPATVDNYVILPLDRLDAGGLPAPDRVPDLPGAGQTFEVDVQQARSFLARPPIRGVAFSLADVHIDRGVVSLERHLPLEFRIQLAQKVTTAEAGRTVSLTAEVFDLRGARRRVLFQSRRKSVVDLQNAVAAWDGRDESGQPVEGGIYVLRVVLEPGQDQARRSFVVVR